eukprot:m.283081 g.283081  ORF g.283081 m.283081 type:complete len:468 (+) comp19870_c0_seq15:67-1470(+)
MGAWNRGAQYAVVAVLFLFMVSFGWKEPQPISGVNEDKIQISDLKKRPELRSNENSNERVQKKRYTECPMCQEESSDIKQCCSSGSGPCINKELFCMSPLKNGACPPGFSNCANSAASEKVFERDERTTLGSSVTMPSFSRAEARRRYSAMYDAFLEDRYGLNLPEKKAKELRHFPIHETCPTFNGNLSVSPEFMNHLKALGPIPKLIHIAWPSPDLLKSRNELVLNGVLQEVELNKKWTARIWTDDEVLQYLKDKLSPKAHKLMESTKIIEKLDLWRLMVMYYEGGFYMDVDRHYNIPLSQLIQPTTKMFMPVHYLVNFAQDIMCTAPFNMLFKFSIHVLLYLREFTQKGGVMKYGPESYKYANCKVIFGYDDGNRVIGGNYPPADSMDSAQCLCTKKQLESMVIRANHTPASDYITAQSEVWYYTMIFNKSVPGWKEKRNGGMGGSQMSQLMEEFHMTHWTKSEN